MDLTVGFADHRPQLAQRRLQVGAALLELLDVGDRLGVLLAGQRIDRPELLAAAGQALQTRPQSLLLLLAQRLGAPPARAAAPGARRPRQLLLGLGGLVAQALSGHLGARHGLALDPQRSLDLSLLLRARAQLS